MPTSVPGKRLYQKRCSQCHGTDAKGNTAKYMSNRSADLTDNNWNNSSGPKALAYVIENGVFGSMPDNKDLTPEEIRDIVTYLESLIDSANG